FLAGVSLAPRGAARRDCLGRAFGAGGHAMSISSVAYETRRSAWTLLADYFELTKPKIAALVLVTEAVAGFVVGWPAGQPVTLQPLVLMHALLGTALIAASASAFNQLFE